MSVPIPLNGTAYVERSNIAGAQETINLYSESNKDDPQAPAAKTYYPFPGSSLFGQPQANPTTVRCTYRTSIGTAYAVVGPSVYYVASNGLMVLIGAIPDRQSQVYMADNGLAVVLVDGVGGWAIDLSSNSFGAIIDASFYGADFVVYLDTFFVFNRPNTNQFYISLSQVTYALLTAGVSFDPLDIAAKSGSADPIVAILAIHKELWLIGELTTEVWIGTGAADFYFQLVQGAYIEHGSIAPYSATNTDVVGFFLMQDRAGKNTIVQTDGYGVKNIGTPYLVQQLNSYPTTADAVGFTFQQDNHTFYVITFTQGNESYVYDLTTGEWARWAKLNTDTGNLDRSRANCMMYAFGKNIAGDFNNGKLYEISATVYTDDSDPIVRRKTFSHIVNGLDRISYTSFMANMEVGKLDAPAHPPLCYLSWSDDRGVTYGFPVPQTLGNLGQYLTNLSWNRLGYARDRIFKLEWSAPIKTALQGAYIDVKQSKT